MLHRDSSVFENVIHFLFRKNILTNAHYVTILIYQGFAITLKTESTTSAFFVQLNFQSDVKKRLHFNRRNIMISIDYTESLPNWALKTTLMVSL